MVNKKYDENFIVNIFGFIVNKKGFIVNNFRFIVNTFKLWTITFHTKVSDLSNCRNYGQ